jgi:hypothetical protein
MNTARVLETDMTLDERATRLESDMGHMRTGMTDLKSDLKSLTGVVHNLRTDVDAFRTETLKEFGTLRLEQQGFKTEMANEFATLRSEQQGFKTEVANEFATLRLEQQGFRTEVVKAFGALRFEQQGFKTEVATDFGTFRAEVAKEFGAVRVSIEALKTAIERAKLWMLITGAGAMISAAGSIITTVVTLAHVLRTP